MGDTGGRRVAVLQSNYVPWRGYFDLIHDVDVFIFYDEVQYTKNDWRNRNRIVTPNGPQWLTVPVFGSTGKSIREVEIVPGRWGEKHYQALRTNYGKAPFFEMYRPWLEEVYRQDWRSLSALNQALIQKIARDFLGIRTQFRQSSDFLSQGKRSEKLLSLLKSSGASTYVSGPAARSYLELSAFRDAGIEVVWKDYAGYPAYPQRSDEFYPAVSILDLLLNVGEKAPELIWGWRRRP